MRNAQKILVGKPDGKRPTGRSRRRCKDNIKIYLQEIEPEGVDQIQLALNKVKWRALANTVMNFGFHISRGISRLAERLSNFQEGLYYMKRV